LGNPAADKSGGSVAEEPVDAGVAAEGVGRPAPEAAADEADPATGDDPTYTPQAVSKKPLGCLIEIAETLILTIVIFWLIQTFVTQPFRVEQESMRTTLEPDQYVLVDKLTPRFDSYSRGDIVVFSPVTREGECTNPIDEDAFTDNTPYIKRVIGEPGDLVELIEGGVYVNGEQLDEPYVRGIDTRTLDDVSTWVVPDGRLFVMGDNRDNSIDSRSEQIGMICSNDVVGRAWLRYWPINTIGILQTPTYPNVPPAEPSDPVTTTPLATPAN